MLTKDQHLMFTKQKNIDKAANLLEPITPGLISNGMLQSVVGIICGNMPEDSLNYVLEEARSGIIYGKDKQMDVTFISEAGLRGLRYVHERCHLPHEKVTEPNKRNKYTWEEKKKFY